MSVASKLLGTGALLLSLGAKDIKAADVVSTESIRKAARTALEEVPKDTIEIASKATKTVEEGTPKSASSYDDVWGGSTAQQAGSAASVTSQGAEASVPDGLEHTTHKGAGIFSYIANLWHSVISFIANLPEILSGTQNVTTHPGKTVLTELKNNPQELNDLATAIERNKGATERIEGAGLKALSGAIDKNPDAIAKLTLALANSSAEVLKKPEGQAALKTFMGISGDALKQVISTPEGQKAMENIVAAGMENAINSPETIQGIGKVIQAVFKSPMASEVSKSTDKKLLIDLSTGSPKFKVVKVGDDISLSVGDYTVNSVASNMIGANDKEAGEFWKDKIMIKGVKVGAGDALTGLWNGITH